MTVKELKEKLTQFPDNYIVCVPMDDYSFGGLLMSYVEVKNVSQGINELDGLVFLDDYEEDDE